MPKTLSALCVTVVALCCAPLAHAAPVSPAFVGDVDLSGTPKGITQGPDGNMWVMLENSAQNNEVAKITPAGVVTEYNDDDLANGGGITAGPDGNLWVLRTNSLAKFSPASPTTATNTPITGLNANFPSGIVVDAAGNLWSAGGDTIFRIPPSAPNTFKAITVTGMSARGIARAGNSIWVADFDTTGSQKAWSVDDPAAANPTATKHDLSNDTAGLQGIAGAPSGQIAYTVPNVGDTVLGRLSPGGSPLNNVKPGATDPFGAVFANDGAFWFADFAADNLGRMDPNGNYSTLKLTPGSKPRWLANGPGGTLWASYEGLTKVGRVANVLPVGQDLPPGDGNNTATTAKVSKLKLSPSTFRRGAKTTISFTLSEKAKAKLSFELIKKGRRVGKSCKAPTSKNRKKKACNRYAKVKTTITVDGKAGANRVSFTGKLSKTKSLKVGSYRLTVKAGNAATKNFKLLAAKKKK
jgi:streptogramin lyase